MSRDTWNQAGIGGNMSEMPTPWAGIPDADPSVPSSADLNRRRQQQYVNRLGVTGGTGGYGFGGMGLTGTGQSNPLQNAGTRRAQNSAVNWGAVAGLGNALQWSPNPGMQAAAFRAQGIMPTSNGVPIDMGQDPQIMRGLERAHNQDAFGMGQRTGSSGPTGGAAAEYLQNYLPGVARQRDQNAMRGLQPNGLVPFGGGAGGQSLFGSPGMPGFGGAGMGGSLGGRPPGPGGAGVTGLPLERGVSGAIQGILSRPSPFTAQQEAQMRSRATSGVQAQRDQALQRMREDAVRRGLNPNEIAGSLSQIGAQYDRQQNEAGLSFDLANAQASRQGLMGGIGAGTGLMGQQLGYNADILRYLAQLGAAQAGQAPMYLSL